jgi:hypothetical protein
MLVRGRVNNNCNGLVGNSASYSNAIANSDSINYCVLNSVSLGLSVIFKILSSLVCRIAKTKYCYVSAINADSTIGLTSNDFLYSRVSLCKRSGNFISQLCLGYSLVSNNSL